MARLHEYQGKAILAANGFTIPRGRAASTPDDAVAAAKALGDEVVIKIQAWTTGRAGIGGVAFAKKADEVRSHAKRMLAMKVGQFPVEAVLVEEKINIEQEFFLSLAIDDAAPARAFTDLLGEYADHLEPRVIDLHVLADRGLVTEQVYFCRFAEDAHRRRARVVLGIEEAAAILQVSAETVMLDWRAAKAWLHKELADGHDT